MYELRLTRNAQKDLRKLHDPTLARILKAIEALKTNPRPPGSKKLAGAEDLWRIRVGNYRVIYSIEDTIRVVTVTRVAHRKDVYDSL